MPPALILAKYRTVFRVERLKDVLERDEHAGVSKTHLASCRIENTITFIIAIDRKANGIRFKVEPTKPVFV